MNPLDRFVPRPDVRERFETTVRAPAALVLRTAADFDMQSLRWVRLIFRAREALLCSRAAPRVAQGLVAETRQLGWGELEHDPARWIVMGARCEPWQADVRFTAIPADAFADYAQGSQVKIAWSLEARQIAPDATRFAQETRAVATDAAARLRFRRYWRWARFGIVAIRLLMLPAVRRDAERRWSATTER